MRSVHNLKKNVLFSKYARRRTRAEFREMKERGEKTFCDIEDLYAHQLNGNRRKQKRPPEPDTGEILYDDEEEEEVVLTETALSEDEEREVRLSEMREEGNEWVDKFISEYNEHQNEDEIDESDVDALATAAIAEKSEADDKRVHRQAILDENERFRQSVERSNELSAQRAEEKRKLLGDDAVPKEEEEEKPAPKIPKKIYSEWHGNQEDEINAVYNALGYTIQDSSPDKEASNIPAESEGGKKESSSEDTCRKQRNINPARKVKFTAGKPKSISVADLGDKPPTEAEIMELLSAEGTVLEEVNPTDAIPPRAESEGWDASTKPTVSRTPLMPSFGQLGKRANGITPYEATESRSHSQWKCPICGKTFYPREWSGAEPIVCGNCLDQPVSDMESITAKYTEALSFVKGGK